MATEAPAKPLCVLCGNHALDSEGLYAKDGAPRAAGRYRCRTCGEYVITDEQRWWIKEKYQTNRAERVRLSAATRNATERGDLIEISSDSIPTLLARLPEPDPLEAADLLLTYIARHSKVGGKPVHLDKRQDFPLIYADGENAFQFIVDHLVANRWIERAGRSAITEYRLTMGGYERLKNASASKRAAAGSSPGAPVTAKDCDVFLSHASEDKAAIARPLYEALVAEGLKVWFDEAVLKMGDSLREKIDDGLARCRYGVVILSPRFLAKRWPRQELNGLVAIETASGEKAILPIWHELDHATLVKYSPTLADRVAGRSEDGIPALVRAILDVVRK
jgi:hypothetical protein